MNSGPYASLARGRSLLTRNVFDRVGEIFDSSESQPFVPSSDRLRSPTGLQLAAGLQHVVEKQNLMLAEMRSLVETHNANYVQLATILAELQSQMKNQKRNDISYDTNPGPDLSSDNEIVTSLDRSEYPRVRFWVKRDWVDYEKAMNGTTKVSRSSSDRRSKGRPGANVSMRYIENIDGMVVDGFQASEMCKYARSIWMQLANRGKAPKTWGKIDMESAQQYHREMCRRFPVLRLCAFDWKADQIATDNYPNWAANYLGTQIKIENGNVESTSSDHHPLRLPKRPYQDQSATNSQDLDMGKDSKRMRTALLGEQAPIVSNIPSMVPSGLGAPDGIDATVQPFC